MISTSHENQAIDSYLRFLIVEKGLSQNTLSAYKQDIKSFLSWLNDRSISLSEISLVIAEDFIRPWVSRWFMVTLPRKRC